jgi:hypothetical protein
MGARKTESTQLCTPRLKELATKNITQGIKYLEIFLRELLSKELLEMLKGRLIIRQLICGVLRIFCEFEVGMLRNGALYWL